MYTAKTDQTKLGGYPGLLDSLLGTRHFVCAVMLRFSHAIFDRNITNGIILLYQHVV